MGWLTNALTAIPILSLVSFAGPSSCLEWGWHYGRNLDAFGIILAVLPWVLLVASTLLITIETHLSGLMFNPNSWYLLLSSV